MIYSELLTKTAAKTASELATAQIEPTPVGSYDLLPDQPVGELVRAEFAMLWDIYAGRRDGMKIQFSDELITDEVVATRYFDKRAIEEVYWRTRVYSPFVKSGVTEKIYVHITTDDGEHEICVNEEGDTRVLSRQDTDSSWEMASPDEVDACLDEFFHRTSDAAIIHKQRSPEEQTIANNHARALLYERYPILALTQSEEE